MTKKYIPAGRIILRDFVDEDRAAFVGYQTDARYRALYDLDDETSERANHLFDLFLNWQIDTPRMRFQLGVFDHHGELLGNVGLRLSRPREAEAGIELSPDNWGRYRLALDAIVALLRFGFIELRLSRIYGFTASGNRRVERLARSLGAEIVRRRDGPDWMAKRGWCEVEWELLASQHQKRVVGEAN